MIKPILLGTEVWEESFYYMHKNFHQIHQWKVVENRISIRTSHKEQQHKYIDKG
jgi:hypothetical protein